VDKRLALDQFRDGGGCRLEKIAVANRE